MLSKESLQQMSEVDVLKAGADSLADINTLSINPSLPIEQRMKNYLKQIGNPYIFLCGDAKVKISFSNTEKTLDSSVIRYFSNLKKG